MAAPRPALLRERTGLLTVKAAPQTKFGTKIDKGTHANSLAGVAAAGEKMAWRFVSEGPWSRRRKHQAVVWQSQVLLLGGFDGEKSFDLNDVWSWNGYEWTEICRKAEWSGRDGHCAIVFNESIYLLGGTDDPYNCKCDVWRSDDGGKAWRLMLGYAPWPERWQHAACVHDGKIFILGGWGDSYLNDVWSSTNGMDWVLVCRQAPWKARMFLSAVSFNDAIYVIGGHDGRQQLRDVWASTDNGVSWTQVCHIAPWEGRQGHACVLLDGFVYIMGGGGQGSIRFNDLWRSSDCAHWTQVSKTSSWSPRQGHAAIVMQGSIYVLGGFDEGGYCNNMFSVVISDVQGTSAATGADGRPADAALAARRSPKTMVLSFVHIFERIGELRARRSDRGLLLKSVEDMKALVRAAASDPTTAIETILDADDSSARFAEELQEAETLQLAASSGGSSPAMSSSGGPNLVLSEGLFQSDPRENFYKSMSAPKADAVPLSDDAPSSISSLELRQRLEDSNKKLAALQRQIRSAAVTSDEETLASLLKQRTELALQQYSLSVRLMQHVSAIRQAQHTKHTALRRLLARAETLHREAVSSFLLADASDDTPDGPLADTTSDCSLEEWAQLEASLQSQSAAVAAEQADAAMGKLIGALQQQASVANRVAGWIDCMSSLQTHALLPAAVLIPSSTYSASTVVSTPPPVPAVRDPLVYEQLSNDFQDSGEDIERCCVEVKTAVESELGAIAAKKGVTKSLVRSAVEKGHGLIKAMITQNSMAMMEQAAERDRVLRWQSIAACLLQIDEIRQRCDLLVAVNGMKEDVLLQLEGERIDRRSSLEKALLQGGRRTQHARPVNRALDVSTGTLRSSSIDTLEVLSSVSTDSGSYTRSIGGGGEIDELKANLIISERAVKEARRGIRSWYRDVRKLALELTPELFKLIPDLQMPGSVLGDGGFAQNAKVPHRLFDDYDNVQQMGREDGLGAEAGSPAAASNSGSSAKQSRHALLKATYDGEEVVLKGFVMHDSDQRKGLERELSILGRLRNDSIICPGAVVEGSSTHTGTFLDNPTLQTTVFIEYPYCRGGNLASWLKAAERKPWELQGVARQLLYGLMYLHDHGVIHKDIKPSNVLMHEDGRVVLADFELSHEVGLGGGAGGLGLDGSGVEPSTTSRSGTKGFMSPEVEADGHALFASDMYSFGVLLFFMHFPQQTAGLVPGDPRIPANNDAELTDLIQRLLAISPSARPTAASALQHPYFRSTFVDRLVQDGEVVEQDRKLDAVRNLLYRARADNRTNLEKLVVHRDTLVDEVLTYFSEMPLERMKASLRITFRGEPGIDEGGLLTEMFTLFFEGVLQGGAVSGKALFEYAEEAGAGARAGRGKGADKTSSPTSQANPDEDAANDDESNRMTNTNTNYMVLPVGGSGASIAKLRAFGRAMVKALYEGRRIGSRLSPSVFKFLTGAKPNMRDLQMYDPQTARSLQWILATAGVADFGLHFESVGAPQLGPVTDLNKADFVTRKIQNVLVVEREAGLLAIKAGFVEALRALSEEAAPFMSLLSHTDWRVMLCGDPAISGQQVLSAMRFSGFNKKSNVPQWLKDILLSFSEDYLRKFLVFVTGSPSLTSTGSNKVEINVRCQSRSGALPVAHTCFLHLDVPDYTSKELLQAKLMYAITNSSGFEVV